MQRIGGRDLAEKKLSSSEYPTVELGYTSIQQAGIILIHGCKTNKRIHMNIGA